MYDSHVEPDLGYETKQISEGRVATVRDRAYRLGVMYGGITRPSTRRYLYPCSPIRRSSGRSAWTSSEYSSTLNAEPLVVSLEAMVKQVGEGRVMEWRKSVTD